MKDLESTVLKNDVCIGCGACAYAEPGRYSMVETGNGFIKALCLDDPHKKLEVISAKQVCPFSDDNLNEDEIAEKVFEQNLPYDSFIGKYIDCYAGRVVDDDIYQNSSSGGIGRWILAELLRADLVDGVIAVFDRCASESGQKLFEYGISRNPDEVLKASKSAYYPVEMSKVLAEIRRTPGRYAITGVPCFIKTVRNLCERDDVLKDRIRFTVGIVCGHLKSKYYAELLGWQLGVKPADLRSLDFRKKLPGKRANEKGVSATSISNSKMQVTPKTVKEMFGTDYGLGYFKYKACDYCDDVVAETADISIGDAWLPEYMDSGTSIIVVRNREISNLMSAAILNEDLKLTRLEADQVFKSQEAGFRHRREGLAYRLDKHKEESWIPAKRVSPSGEMKDPKYKEIFDIRERVVTESAKNFKEAKSLNDLQFFQQSMASIERSYKFAYSKGIKRMIRVGLDRLGIDEQIILKLKRKWLN